MRRKEREVTDDAVIRQILDECQVCHLGLVEEGKPYVVPLNFGYTLEKGELYLYFHSALAGRKLDILRRNPHVAFAIDRTDRLVTGPNACDYTMDYRSILGEGTARLIEDPAEKRKALDNLMRQFTKETLSMPERNILAVAAIEVKAERFTAKESGIYE